MSKEEFISRYLKDKAAAKAKERAEKIRKSKAAEKEYMAYIRKQKIKGR